MTGNELIKFISNRLEDTYQERSEAESVAKIYLLDVLQIPKSQWSCQQSIDRKKLETDLHLLEEHYPIQYISHTAWFYGEQFYVDENVLIPRPETEELVYYCVQENQILTPKIIDIGTGSGCIAITLKKKIPDALVYASDQSKQALEVAKKNAQKLNADVLFIQDDILNSKITEKDFDIIISNPPYIPWDQKSLMDTSVKKYEPTSALYVENEDPLLFYNKILDFASLHGKKGGKIWFEINSQNPLELERLLKEKGYVNYQIIDDMQGQPRVTCIENSV